MNLIEIRDGKVLTYRVSHDAEVQTTAEEQKDAIAVEEDEEQEKDVEKEEDEEEQKDAEEKRRGTRAGRR